MNVKLRHVQSRLEEFRNYKWSKIKLNAFLKFMFSVNRFEMLRKTNTLTAVS